MLLALDLGTNLGACYGTGDCLPVLANHRLPSTGDDVGAFACAFEDWFRGRLPEIEPALVVFEAPILPAQTQLITVRKLQGLACVTEMVCTREGLECREVHLQEAKKALTGKGNAKKFEMVASCRDFGLDPVSYGQGVKEASDEADAFGGWLFSIRLRKPEHRSFWEPPSPLLDGVRL